MSDEARYYAIGNRRGLEGKSDPLIPAWNVADKVEAAAAQRGWEAGQAARSTAEAIREAQEDD